MNELLHFAWPHGKKTPFSFDLGGRFRGGELAGQSFVAEVKAYRKENDLPEHYRDFLAKAYVAYRFAPKRCANFLWISWSPFKARTWDEHATEESVRRAVLSRSQEVFGTDAENAKSLLDERSILDVADRIWLITLSDRQEKLVITAELYQTIQNQIFAASAS